MKKICVGIDIAKLSFVSAIKVNEKDIIKSFSNNEGGFKKFIEWLQSFSAESCHCCMESTGKYGKLIV